MKLCKTLFTEENSASTRHDVGKTFYLAADSSLQDWTKRWITAVSE